MDRAHHRVGDDIPVKPRRVGRVGRSPVVRYTQRDPISVAIGRKS